MLDEYIRGCENSTLANVLTPFCTALGVQTPLYCVRILYSIEVQISLYCVRILYIIALRYMCILHCDNSCKEKAKTVMLWYEHNLYIEGRKTAGFDFSKR